MLKLTGSPVQARVVVRRAMAVMTCVALAAACGNPGQAGSGGRAAVHESVANDVRAMLPARIRDSGSMSVAITATFPPYGFVTADGKFTGFSYDLAQQVAKVLGVTFHYENAKHALAVTGLQAGKYDLAITAITDDAAGEKVITLVDWIKRNSHLLVAKGNPKGIDGIESFCDGKLRIAITNASAQAPFVRSEDARCKAAGKRGIDIGYFDNSNATVLALGSGRADAVMLDTLAGAYAAKKNGDLATVGPSYLSGVYGWGVGKDDAELARAIQAALQKLVADGTYQKILQSYGATGNAVDTISVDAGSTS